MNCFAIYLVCIFYALSEHGLIVINRVGAGCGGGGGAGSPVLMNPRRYRDASQVNKNKRVDGSMKGVWKLVVRIGFVGSNHGERMHIYALSLFRRLPYVFRFSLLWVIIHLLGQKYHEFCII